MMMVNPSFTLKLTQKSRSRLFILTGGTITYPITFQPEADKELIDLLNRLNRVLSTHQFDPCNFSHSLFRKIGSKLWSALLPSTVSDNKREALIHHLRADSSPLLLDFPPSLMMLPWE